jgi:hypothetical protein
MRPYLFLSAVVLVAAAAFGQQPFSHSGLCLYGCGPFIPLATTPEISLQSVSPNPVGASNATTGLIAGATNSTLSQIQGSTSSEYTAAVWYQGGAPLTTPQVRLWPETVGREGHIMHGGMMHEAMEEHGREEHGERAEKRTAWTFYSGGVESSAMESAGHAKTGKKATHTYTNDDVARENDKNGSVKYNGKTEKI